MESKYQIEGILGEGAMAVVYRARHRELGSLHAIKKLKNEDPSIRDRLIQEGRLQASFKHPNVLTVTDLVVMDGCPALVMEYIQGPSLDEFLHKHRPSLSQCDALARDILKGVAAAHAHGMVHRDLKPSNILVAVTEDSLIPKIADFGLAKVLDESKSSHQLTETGITMGTPAYMAPEQINNFSEVDARADVFSLGAILYELMTGKICFSGHNFMGVWDRIQRGDFSPPAELVPELPQRMSNAISEALEVEKERRIPGVSDLFERWCTNESGEHVPIAGNLNLNFWSQELRNMVSSLAPQDIQSSNQSHNFIEEANTIALPTNDMPSIESNAPQDSLQTQAPLSFTSEGKSMIRSIAVAVTSACMVFLLVNSFGFNGSPWGGGNGNSGEIGNPSGNGKVSMKQFYNQAPNEEDDDTNKIPIAEMYTFGSPSNISAAEKDSIKQIVSAILKGDYRPAIKLTDPLLQENPNDPLLNSIKGIIIGLQGYEQQFAEQIKYTASLEREQNLPLSQMISLSAESLHSPRNDNNLNKWTELTANNDYPIVHLLHLLSTRRATSHSKHIENIRAVRQQHPKWVGLYTLEHMALDELGQDKMMLQLAELGLSQHPGNTRLLVEKGEAQLSMGQLDTAEVNLNQALKQDQHSIEALMGLAEIAYIRDVVQNVKFEEDDILHSGYLIRATNDVLDLDEQVKFLKHYANIHYNHGQMKEGDKILDFCIKMSLKANDKHKALSCLSANLDALYWLTPSAQWAPLMSKMRQLVSMNQSSNKTVKRHKDRLILADVQIALDQKREKEAQRLLETIQKTKSTQSDAKLPKDPILDIQIALAIQSKDVSQSLNLIEKVRQIDIGAVQSCKSHFYTSQVAAFQEKRDAEIASLSHIAQGKCRDDGDKGMIMAFTRLKLANLHLKNGAKAKAKEQLDNFRKDWRLADSNLMALKEAKKLEKRLR